MRSVLFVGVALAAAGLAQSAEASLLSYCAEGPVEGFDPARYVTAATFDGSSQLLYNRLVEFQPGTATIVPGLAESWDVSKDGLTYTFHLRDDVKFRRPPGSRRSGI